MGATPPLQPTLWRTCRVLANRTRLRVFRLLVEQPGGTVSTVARHLQLPLPVASQYLRALEARGFLTARRAGLRVAYRPSAAGAAAPAPGLVAALRVAIQEEPAPIERLFKLATAFTHPRRIEIFRALRDEPRTLGQLQAATGISVRALHRHLRKLEARGLVASRQAQYTRAKAAEGFARELARLAAG